MKPKKTQDVIQAVISDTHTAGNTALFIDRQWTGRNTSHYPNSAQIEIRAQAVKYCAKVAAARKGKKLILVLNGDAIDGDHHHSGDVCTLNELEQADIHIELMTELRTRMNWQAGDGLYYTKGTNTHTHEMENYIGRELNAVPSGDFYSWDFLPLEVNGVLSWFVHHGISAGAGANTRYFIHRSCS